MRIETPVVGAGEQSLRGNVRGADPVPMTGGTREESDRHETQSRGGGRQEDVSKSES